MNTPIEDFPDSADTAIADALQTYPYEPAPGSLFPGVMARLQALPMRVRPRFRLGWLEYALGLFTTSMAGLGYMVWQSLPPQVLARLQVEWLIALQRVGHLLSMLPSLPGR
jgi:hypothetical protein